MDKHSIFFFDSGACHIVLPSVLLKMNKSEAYLQCLPQPISSMSKVPIEIFAEIFLHVVSDTGEQEGTQSSTDESTARHTSSYRSRASPFSLSHVCHNWRILSLSLPALWTNLRVICPRNTKLVFLLSTWIKRARMRSLNLSLKQPLLSGTDNDMTRINEIDPDFQATKAVWELFLSVMDRWGSLEVDVRMSFETLTKGAGDFIGRNWSVPIKLESIKASFGTDIADHGKDVLALIGAQHLPRQSSHQGYHNQKLDEITFFACLLHCSPRLRSAEWDNKHVCLHLGLVSQLWDTLTELTLFTSQDIPSLILSLSKCQSLQKLTIHEQVSVDRSLPEVHGTDPACTLVTLCNLQTLTLGTFANPELFFSHLTVPNLHTLVIVNGRNGKKGWRGLGRDAWFALSEMLARSSEAELTTLIVGGWK